MKKWYYGVAAVVALAIAAYFLFRPSRPKAASSVYVPQSETIQRGDLTVIVTATGTIEPINKVEIKSKASGLIEELKINESDQVKIGDLIARLDQKDTRNNYDQAVANLEVADANLKQKQSELTRKQELFNKGLISNSEFDIAKLAVVEAQAQLVRSRIDVDNSDIRLKETIVRSPINGIILTKDVETGQIISSGISSVSGGTLIATVADMREVYVKADVDEVDIGKIAPGMKAKVVADAYPDKTFQGQVLRIAAQSSVVQNVTTFEVTILVDNAGGRLKAGMNATVDILVADKKNVLLVSNEALMSDKELFSEMQKVRIAMGGGQGEAGRSGRPGGGEASGRRREQGGEGRMGRGSGAGLRPGAGAAEGAPPSGREEGQEVTSRRGVILKTGEGFRPRMIKTGVSNYDYTEVLEGLQEGDEVAYAFFSRAKESSDRMKQRMTERNNMNSGFRNQSSSSSSQTQTPSAPPPGGGPR